MAKRNWGPYKKTQIAALDAYPGGAGVQENHLVYPGTLVYPSAEVDLHSSSTAASQLRRVKEEVAPGHSSSTPSLSTPAPG